jgi:hypothetical protein
LYLLSQLGLANPAAVAWELVPFSFVVDWFTDAGTFINSFTDFLGCSVTNSYQVHILKFEDHQVYTYAGAPGPPATVSGWAAARGTTIIRPVPNTNFRANLGNSINRAANALALATQLLTGMDGMPLRGN